MMRLFGRMALETLLMLTLTVHSLHALLDPISLMAVGGAVGLGSYFYDSIKENTYCRVQECCTKRYVKHDLTELHHLLHKELYGQHIVQESVVNAVGGHLRNIERSQKPLVMSFHGTPGTGKNFVAKHIVDALYLKGMESKYVHKYQGRSDFRLESMVPEYKHKLYEDIRQAVQKCRDTLFIFDEVEKMPPGVFDAIVSLLDHHSSIKGLDFRRTIFIFLSNIAGAEISQMLKRQIDSGKWREQTTLNAYEPLIEIAAYNVEGGLFRSEAIESHVIDHFIPFLPLEQRHVVKCIENEYRNLAHRKIDEESLNAILADAVTFDETGIFSNNGCKKISKKVEAYVYQRQRKDILQ